VWKVGVVQPMFEEGIDGFGFIITDAREQPVARLTYETRVDAEAAAAHNATSVRGLNTQ